MVMQSTVFSRLLSEHRLRRSAVHDPSDAPAEAEVTLGTSAQAGHLAKGSTVRPASASVDDDDFAAAIQRVAAARPHLAVEARHSAGEILDDDALLTKSVIKHTSENLYRLLRLVMLRHQIPQEACRIWQCVYNAKKLALRDCGPSVRWSKLPVVLSPVAQARLLAGALSEADLVPDAGEMVAWVERFSGVQGDSQRSMKKARKS